MLVFISFISFVQKMIEHVIDNYTRMEILVQVTHAKTLTKSENLQKTLS